MRLLVLDAYAGEGREALREAGATEAGELYRRMLARLAPEAELDVVYPADRDAPLPRGRALSDYYAAAWTGSSLSIVDLDDPRVARQIEFARALLAEGIPAFGSCWATQLAAVAAGGHCAASARGREFGVSRRITLSAEGAAHPLYRGKPRVFDALTCHADEVAGLPEGATLLASNDWSRVQSFAVEAGAGSFWAVQYHPEYDLHELAALCVLRSQELIQQGTFASPREAARYVDALEVLHEDPSREDLVAELDLEPSVLDDEIRVLEVRNWLAHVRSRRDR